MATTTTKFNYNLEALRGVAALVVVLHHAIIQKYSLDSHYYPKGDWVNPLPGHSNVLLFFILSGYVIGLVNKKPLDSNSILPYLRKRFARLYPIYVVSLVVTFLVLKRHYLLTTLIGQFFFLQQGVVPVVWENNPLWSLHFEVLYYLLFIPISFYRISVGRVFFVALGLGALFITLLPVELLSSYCFGFAFWVSGLWLAQSEAFAKQVSSRMLLYGLLFIFLGYQFLNPFIPLLDKLLIKVNGKALILTEASISIFDLLQMPFCFYLFLRFTNQGLRKNGLIDGFFIATTLAYSIHTFTKIGFFAAYSLYLWVPMLFFLIGTVFVVISSVLKKEATIAAMPNSLIKLGALSYGIYVIHFPISVMLSHITVFDGSALSYCIRLLLDIPLVILAAYVLELKIQPWLKNKLGLAVAK